MRRLLPRPGTGTRRRGAEGDAGTAAVAAEPTAEALEPGELKSDRDRLEFLYEVESATIDEELSAISKLEASWPRSLLASTVANQAQHLTLLRQALGAGAARLGPGPVRERHRPPPE